MVCLGAIGKTQSDCQQNIKFWNVEEEFFCHQPNYRTFLELIKKKRLKLGGSKRKKFLTPIVRRTRLVLRIRKGELF